MHFTGTKQELINLVEFTASKLDCKIQASKTHILVTSGALTLISAVKVRSKWDIRANPEYYTLLTK